MIINTLTELYKIFHQLEKSLFEKPLEEPVILVQSTKRKILGTCSVSQVWENKTDDTDIIITHCPPFGINDQVRGISQGCPALRDRIKEIKPRFHICGHIHEGYGVYRDEFTTYINASLLNEFYDLVNKPMVIDYDD